MDRLTASALFKGRMVRPEATQPIQTALQGTEISSPHFKLRRPFNERDQSDPVLCAAKLIQRGRLILDVSAVDLEVSEATFGAFHPTTWHFRQSLSEA